jgi:hypothetical protein
MPDEGQGALSEEPPAFMSAPVTEHFSLQSISSATISESGSRAALYLSALSSGLVAIGFASSSRQDLEALGLLYESQRLAPLIARDAPAGATEELT